MTAWLRAFWVGSALLTAVLVPFVSGCAARLDASELSRTAATREQQRELAGYSNIYRDANAGRPGAAPVLTPAPPGSVPAPDEELWVIQKTAGAKPQAADEVDVPGT